MGEVTHLRPAENPDVVLEQAIGAYESVVILGWTKEGGFSGRVSLNLETGDALLLVELFKQALLDMAVE